MAPDDQLKVKLHTLHWHDKFTYSNDKRVFTLERGADMMTWVSWIDANGDRHTGQMYIGEEVVPCSG